METQVVAPHMEIQDFSLERWQSQWEHLVDVNLAESSVEGVPLRDLVSASPDPDGLLQELLDQRLAYTQTNGSCELRQRIAALYPGATEENIQVTTGGSEANFSATWHLMGPGAEMVAIVPNYPQVLGLAEGFGGKLVPCSLEPDRNKGTWKLDVDQLRAAVNENTRLIAICTPNNPTGAVLSDQELDRIAEIASSVSAWVLSDEIYNGSEHSGEPSPSFWGRYEHTVLVSGMSKAYGLPGLRIGWAVTTAELGAEVWRRRDYTTIAPSALSDLLARHALSPEVRPTLLARTRETVVENYRVLEQWAAENPGLLHWVPPTAGAFVFASYEVDVGSIELAQRLRTDYNVLIAPGAHFGIECHLRLGFGFATDPLIEALDRLAKLLRSL